MNKITSFIEKHIAPMANKIVTQRHIRAIQNVFLSLIPFMTVGSFALIIIEPAADYAAMDPGLLRSFFYGWHRLANAVGYPLETIFSSAMGMLSLYVVIGTAHNLAKSYKLESFIPASLSLASFLIFSAFNLDLDFSPAYFDGTGLFAAIFVGIIVTEIYNYLIKNDIGKIEIGGEGVPDALKSSFSSFVPVTIILLISGFGSYLFLKLFNAQLPAIIGVVIEPLIKLVDNVWGVAILSIVVMVLWWFGIHDTVITGPLTPFFTSNLVNNATAFASGTSIYLLPYVVTEPFWFTFMAIGGSGATLGLGILALRSRSKHIRMVGKLAIVPSIFNINEPLIFGLPIMFNPTLFIPFVGVMTLNGVISFLLMQWGVIGKTFVNPSWNMFSPIGALISTADIKALILVCGLIIIDVLIYLPFFKVYERQKLKEESEEI